MSGFSESLGSLPLQVVDAVAKVVTTDGREILLKVNQELYKPRSTQSLMSTPQVRSSGTRVDTTWVQHDETSNFGLVLEDEEHGRLVVPFTLDGISAGFSVSSRATTSSASFLSSRLRAACIGTRTVMPTHRLKI